MLLELEEEFFLVKMGYGESENTRSSEANHTMMEIEASKPAGNGLAPCGLSPLSETLWREKTDVEFVGDVSARLTWKGLGPTCRDPPWAAAPCPCTHTPPPQPSCRHTHARTHARARAARQGALRGRELVRRRVTSWISGQSRISETGQGRGRRNDKQTNLGRS